MNATLKLGLVAMAWLWVYTAALADDDSTTSGNWSDGSTWADGGAPGTTGGYQGNIDIETGHEVTRNGDLLVNNGTGIDVFGDLVITGDLTLRANITVQNGGRLVIVGEYDSDNGGFLKVESGGKVAFVGDITMSGGAIVNNNNTSPKGAYNLAGLDVSGGAGTTGTALGNQQDLEDTDAAFNTYVTGITGALPVTWLYVQARTGSMLHWATSQEINAQHFEIQESLDGFEFSPLGQVAAQGNSNATTHYQYALPPSAAAAVRYVRLKQVDFDGHFSYSPVITIVGHEDQWLQALPNPVTQEAAHYITPPEGHSLVWHCITGQLAGQQSGSDAPPQLVPGIYEVQLLEGQRPVARRRIIIAQ